MSDHCYLSLNCFLFNHRKSKQKCLLQSSVFCLSRLVQKINISIGQDSNSKCLIGVLDIYGFESFQTNR